MPIRYKQTEPFRPLPATSGHFRPLPATSEMLATDAGSGPLIGAAATDMVGG